jgi:glucose dehydrogenase
VWIDHSGIPDSSETNPIVDGVMYFTTVLDPVIALDTAPGRRKWEHVHDYKITVGYCATIDKSVQRTTAVSS